MLAMLWPKLGKYVIGAVVLAAIVLSIWMYGNHRESQGYERRNVEAQLEAADLLRVARSKEQAAQSEMNKVKTDAYENQKLADAAVTSARSESERLRLDIARERAKSKSAGTSAGADAGAARAWELFDACRVRYEAVARDADRYVEWLRIGQGWAGVVEGALK